ncbi:ferredoxin [Antrihabitans sp. YC2-6]|uniref:ferredoxin n=1 Tax=Antrihabitans sp. YC2-6 TaxID=2799498 RepID=UPI0018F79889|nr:ferredoxin [Antrihabitans sp. YC2-6]MBJ8348264.1 ferredoxin [Antrihabitans sp. YC2-6]
MKISIDTHACNGYGNCAFAAPDVFDVDLARNLAVLKDDVDLDTIDLDLVREAAEDCPVRAILLEE